MVEKVLNKVKSGVNYVVDFLKANKVWAIVIAAACALMVICIIALICKAAKNAKANKASKAAKEAAAPVATQIAESVKPAPAQAAQSVQPVQAAKTVPPAQTAAATQTAEDKEAARQATLARLEAERLAAEKEEAEEAARLAAEQAEKEKAEKAAKAAEAKAKREAAAKARSEKEAKTEVAATEAKKPAAAKAKTVKAEKSQSTAPAKQAEKEETVNKTTPTSKAKTAAKTTTKTTAKTPAKATPAPAATEESTRYSGKWTVFRLVTEATDDTPAEETYFFELRASNGEKLLSSEEYTSLSGALKGIETHKNNIEKGNFRVGLTKKGEYIFKLLSGKNMLLCTGENYKTRVRCESAIESTKRFAKSAVIDEKVKEKVIKLPVEDDNDGESTVTDNANGKWIIVGNKGADGEDLFYFELFANNGEKLLSSEEYTSYAGALNGIQTHRANIEKGNFRIALTKKGDYIYKLLGGNGQLLCLGEHYKTKHRCQSAVESVKRFAKNSPILTDPEHTDK